MAGMDRNRFVVSDAVWAKVADLLPGKATDPGATGKDNRLFLEAGPWRVRTGVGGGAPGAQGGARPRPLRGGSKQRFEPWTGLHRHAPMTCIAFAWLQHLRLAGQRPTGPGENAAPRSGAATIAGPARGAPRRRRAAVRASRRAGPMSAPQAALPTAS